MKVLVMGGGLAGLSAAVNLVDNGFDVTLVEVEERLGGRASSWKDEDGHTIDNALHVFFPHYINILTFFEHVGGKDVIRWTDTLTYYKDDGNAANFKPYKLPAPLHGMQIMEFQHISLMDIIRFGPAAMRCLSMSESSIQKYDKVTVEDFLHQYGASDHLIKNMMRAMISGLTFLEPWEVSAKAMAYWIRNLTMTSDAMKVGFARGGLGDIYVDRAIEYIKKAGGEVLTGKAVKSIDIKDSKAVGVTLEDGTKMEADVYVSALSFQSLRTVLPKEAFEYKFFEKLWMFEDAPSMSAQVWWDRKVMHLENIATGIDTMFNWFADLSQIIPEEYPDEGSMLEYVITPCKHLLPLDDAKIAEMVIEDTRAILPEARDAKVVKWKIVRERQGVYAQTPHMDEYRPTQRTPIDNLYLAGDFTKAGHSAGMEGAVISGKMVTSTILQDKMGITKDFVMKADFGQGLIPFIKWGQPILLALIVLKLIKRRRSRK